MATRRLMSEERLLRLYRKSLTRRSQFLWAFGATFQGGLGMAASGNLHAGRTSMFEPVHGSAPKFAGKNIANPMGAILSAALMLETLGRIDEARLIESAVEAAVHAGQTTADIGGTLGTREVGRWIASQIENGR